MKRIALLAILALFGLTDMASAGDTYVRGYIKRDGTVVQPHYRTAPDGNPFNNYSTQGNVNPYNGNVGTVNPYAQPSPSYGLPPVYRPINPYANPMNPYGQ